MAEPVAKPHALSLLEMDASVQSVGNWASLKPADAPNELYCMAERRPVAGIATAWPCHQRGDASKSRQIWRISAAQGEVCRTSSSCSARRRRRVDDRIGAIGAAGFCDCARHPVNCQSRGQLMCASDIVSCSDLEKRMMAGVSSDVATCVQHDGASQLSSE